MFNAGLVRIGNDPVVRYTSNNEPVIDLNLAYNYGRKDASGKYPTQWINATLWGPRAEKLGNFLQKGRQIFVVLTDLHLEQFTKKDGGQGAALRARVSELQFAGEKVDKPVEPKKTSGFNDLDDDIPFNI
jgi:single-strand DNA-binding protein